MGRLKNLFKRKKPKKPMAAKKVSTAIGNQTFVSAEVTDIVMDPTHKLFNPAQSITIGAIRARILTTQFNAAEADLLWYHPIFGTGVYQPPLIGEVVLLIQAIGSRGQVDQNAGELYYLPPINVWQDVNNNQLPASSFHANIKLAESDDSEEKACNPSGQYSSATGNPKDREDVSVVRFGEYFQHEDIPKIFRYEGDQVIEGRFGNSLRFGATQKLPNSKNYWSGAGSDSDPITIFSSGHRPEKDSEYHLESINNDDGVVMLTSTQRIPLAVTALDGDTLRWDSYGNTPTVAKKDEFEINPKTVEVKETEVEVLEEKEDVKKEDNKRKGDEDGESNHGNDITEPVVVEDANSEEVKKENEHNCDKTCDATDKKVVEIALKIIAGGGSKKYTDLGWMDRSNKTVCGANPKGGECWTGILHWTGYHHRTLYEAMDSYKIDGKTAIETFFNFNAYMPQPDPSKGQCYGLAPKKSKYSRIDRDDYSPSNADKFGSNKINLRFLKHFSEYADTKELNYSWWETGMRNMIHSDYNKKIQDHALISKYKSSLKKVKAKGWNTMRQFAVICMYANSCPGRIDEYGEKHNWDAEKMLQSYCSGEVPEVSCCRSRCNHINDHYPPCIDQEDKNNKHYSEYVWGGCTEHGSRPNKYCKYPDHEREAPPQEKTTVFVEVGAEGLRLMLRTMPNGWQEYILDDDQLETLPKTPIKDGDNYMDFLDFNFGSVSMTSFSDGMRGIELARHSLQNSVDEWNEMDPD